MRRTQPIPEDITNEFNYDVTTGNIYRTVRNGTLFRAEVCIHGKRYQKHSKDVSKLQAWVTAKRQELHGEYAR